MHGDAAAGISKFVLFFRVIVCFEFLRHVDRARFKIRQNCVEHLDDGWNPTHEGQIHRLNLWPEWKRGISDDERVRVANPAEQVLQVRVDYSLDDHRGAFSSVRSKAQATDG